MFCNGPPSLLPRFRSAGMVRGDDPSSLLPMPGFLRSCEAEGFGAVEGSCVVWGNDPSSPLSALPSPFTVGHDDPSRYRLRCLS